MLSWPFFLKKNGTRRKSPLRTIREFALKALRLSHGTIFGIGISNYSVQANRAGRVYP
jgi:hypothetical protein